MMNEITVIKIGGSTFGQHDTTLDDLVTLQSEGVKLIVVHGGGATVTAWMKKQGIEAKFVRGERVTDRAALEIATAVLSGLANKELVAAINLKGGRAAGISGVDGALIESRLRNPEMGYVGDVVKVNTGILQALLSAGFMPIVSPISLFSEGRNNDAPGFINVNGDPIAGTIAAAMGAARLIYMTDVDGVKDSAGNRIKKMTAAEAEGLIQSGVISGGMIPKITACLKAVMTGTRARIIDGTRPNALVKEMRGQDGGTTLCKE